MLTGILFGVLGTLAVSGLIAIAWDAEVRDAVASFLWALLVAPITLAWLGAAMLLSRLPQRYRPRMVRGRRLSVRALQRVADRARTDGWMVSTRRGAIVILRKAS